MDEKQDIKDIEQRLKEPLPVDAIEWRVSRAGNNNGKMWARVLAYKTSRADMDRLDEVFGIGGWKDEYVKVENSFICGISAKIDGEWITKYDGADETNFEAFKGGLSSAFKRAASKWGIGRYLYKLDETFVNVVAQKPSGANGEWNYINDTKQNVKGYWQNPDLPEWAKPQTKTPNLDKFYDMMKQNAAKLPEPFRADARVIVGKKQEITDQRLQELEAAIFEHVENFDNGVK